MRIHFAGLLIGRPQGGYLLYGVIAAWILILISACVSWLYMTRPCLLPT